MMTVIISWSLHWIHANRGIPEEGPSAFDDHPLSHRNPRKSFFFPIYFLHLQGGKNCLPLFDFVYLFFLLEQGLRHSFIFRKDFFLWSESIPLEQGLRLVDSELGYHLHQIREHSIRTRIKTPRTHPYYRTSELSESIFH